MSLYYQQTVNKASLPRRSQGSCLTSKHLEERTFHLNVSETFSIIKKAPNYSTVEQISLFHPSAASDVHIMSLPNLIQGLSDMSNLETPTMPKLTAQIISLTLISFVCLSG